MFNYCQALFTHLRAICTLPRETFLRIAHLPVYEAQTPSSDGDSPSSSLYYLGASRAAIVRYFQVENLLITVGGVALGVSLAVAANLWMMSTFEMTRLSGKYLVVGAVVVGLLGQLAAFWPALRAASISPATATRST